MEAPKQRNAHEKIDVQNLTNSLLKICNIIRDKNYGSNLLFKRTGVVCGAKSGSGNVF